jgi:hypothetical protein
MKAMADWIASESATFSNEVGANNALEARREPLSRLQ